MPAKLGKGENGALSRAIVINPAKSAWEEHWLDLPDGTLRYLKAGPDSVAAQQATVPVLGSAPGVDGRRQLPPLVLVHGLMGYSFSWRFTIPAIARYTTVYAIDNLGAGFSKCTAKIDCTLRATAERLLVFADAVGLSTFDVLGTSHGGGVAMLAAAICAERQENRLQRLVLVAPINPWSPHGRWLAPFLSRPFGSFLFRHSIERCRVLDPLWLRRLFGDPARIPADSLDGYRVPLRANRALQHGHNIVRTWLQDLDEIERILPIIANYRTLLVWGSHDRAVSVASAERLRRAFRDGALAILDGVGHLPYEEAPEQFNRTLIEFLTRE